MRSLLSYAHAALYSLAAHRTRSALTAMGIGIAVAAVVSITGVATSARESMSARVASLGSNAMVVVPHAVVGAGLQRAARATLSDADVEAVRQELPTVRLAAPWLSTRSRVVNADRSTTTTVSGTTTEFFEIRGWSFEDGEAWSSRDQALKSRVCVLGKTTSERLFGTESAVGRSVRIGRHPYQVVGVLSAKGEDPTGADEDDVVLLPISSMRARVLRTAPGFAGSILISAAQVEDETVVQRELDGLLRQRHSLQPESEPDFEIHSQQEFQSLEDSIARILTALLIAIAGVSLVVGGVGVMNVMLVGVTERTREIGLKLAIGATARETRFEFLAEAIVLTVFGGAAGALAGCGVAAVAAWVMDWPVAISATAMVLGVTVSALVGVVFGALPAWRAGALQPADAMRAE